MRAIQTDMGMTYLTGETVFETELQQPIGFVHFGPKSQTVITDTKLTWQEKAEFWTRFSFPPVRVLQSQEAGNEG